MQGVYNLSPGDKCIHWFTQLFRSESHVCSNLRLAYVLFSVARNRSAYLVCLTSLISEYNERVRDGGIFEEEILPTNQDDMN